MKLKFLSKDYYKYIEELVLYVHMCKKRRSLVKIVYAHFLIDFYSLGVK